MKRWASLILTVAMALSVLSVGVFAAASPDPVTLDNGIVLTKETSGTTSTWTVTGYTGQGGLLIIPEEYKSENDTSAIKITKIDAGAFSTTDHGKKLTDVIFPCTISEVGDSAFDGCTGLKTVIFLKQRAGGSTPSDVKIKERAFADCFNLADLVLPEKLTDIGIGAFAGTKALQAVAIPETVTNIEERAFANSGLKTVFIPKSFDGKKSISGSAFASCPLDSIHSDASPINKVWSFFENNQPPVRESDCFHSAVKAREMSLPNCTAGGTVIGGASCTVIDKDKQKDSCTLLNKSISIPALGHQYEDVQGADHKIEKATCIAAGKETIPQECARCHAKSTREVILPIDPENHNYTVEETDQPFEASCTEKGLERTRKFCSLCHKAPVCEQCETLEKALTNARDAIEEKKEALDKATAEKIAAAEDLAKAETALETAQKARTDAENAEKAALTEFAKAAGVEESTLPTDAEWKSTVEGIKATYDQAQSAVQTQQTTIDELKKKIEDLQKDLEAAADDAEKTRIEGEIAQAQESLKAAEGNLEPLKTLAEEQTKKWGAVNPAYTELLTAHAALQNAGNSVQTAQGAVDDAAAVLGKEEDTAAGTPATGAIKKFNDAQEAYNNSSTDIEAAKKALSTHITSETHYRETADPKTKLEDGLITGKEIPALNHPKDSLGEPHTKPNETQKIPDCVTGITIILPEYQTCGLCGEEIPTGTFKEIKPAGTHKRPDDVKGETKIPATCEDEGVIVYPACKCMICGADIKESEEKIEKLGHLWGPAADEVIDEPDCTHEGHIRTGVQECQRENCSEIETTGKPAVNRDESVVITTPALGHEWGDFVPDAGQDATQAEDCHEKEVTGSAKCTRCGESSDKVTITIPGKADHTWGEWTLDADGKTETRVCKVCNKKETRPATPQPDDPCKDGHTWGKWIPNADGKTETRTCQVCGKTETRDIVTEPDVPDPDTEYTITVVQGAGGTIRVSAEKAKAGTSITVTVTPDSGFELDMVRIIGDTTAEDLTGGRRSFIMPASNVKVQASFTRSSSGTGWGGIPNDGSGYNRTDPTRTQPNTPVQIVPNTIPQAGSSGQLFWDVPSNHWAAGEIAWANDMEYMNGSNGMFNPNEPITMQQMWMVLARLNGTYPADMTEARRWAVVHSFADGSSPTGPVTRQQLMTALYRCAYLQGAVTRSNGSLAGFADSRLVPAVARDAFVWGVSNGIITGDSSNRLRPTGVVSRAEFAVFLYRYDLRV